MACTIIANQIYTVTKWDKYTKNTYVCPACYAQEIPKGANVCIKCGAKLRWASGS